MESSGETILFLVPGAVPERGWAGAVSATAELLGEGLGSFQSRRAPGSKRGGGRFQRLLKKPTLDNGLFMNRDAFYSTGGFGDAPPDELVTRLRDCEVPIKIISTWCTAPRFGGEEASRGADRNAFILLEPASDMHPLHVDLDDLLGEAQCDKVVRELVNRIDVQLNALPGKIFRTSDSPDALMLDLVKQGFDKVIAVDACTFFETQRPAIGVEPAGSYGSGGGARPRNISLGRRHSRQRQRQT